MPGANCDIRTKGGSRGRSPGRAPSQQPAVQGSGENQLPRTLSRGGRPSRSSAPVGSGWPGAQPSGYSQAQLAPPLCDTLSLEV